MQGAAQSSTRKSLALTGHRPPVPYHAASPSAASPYHSSVLSPPCSPSAEGCPSSLAPDSTIFGRKATLVQNVKSLKREKSHARTHCYCMQRGISTFRL